MSIKLNTLLADYPCRVIGDPSGIAVDAIEYDSRRAKSPETLFFCMPGARMDGHDFAPAVYEAGCRAFVVERELDLPDDAVQIVVSHARESLAHLSARFYGSPADKLTLIGLTGTKGKTTTAILIREILCSCGIPCAYIGSNGIRIGDKHYETVNTTPESRELHRYFALMVESGVTHCVMEVSSQALNNYRVCGLTFETVVYTNLSEDHIGAGEHASFDEYRDAKRKLFTRYGAKNIVYNLDDANHAYMIDGSGANLVSCSIANDADFKASDIRPYRDSTSLGIDFDVDFAGVKTGIRMRTPGEFSVYNGLEAIAVCSLCGLSVRQASDALRTISINGRFEIVDALSGVTFIIDYAHNGFSLTHALEVLRAYNPRRLICVFGCIGGRTQIRRKELAEASGRLADFTVITSDNPDNEDQDVIIEDVLTYFDKSRPYTTITDREEAVRFTVRIADEGDIVLFAGKGHETYQIVAGEKIPFSEKAIILDEAAKILAAQPV